MIIPREKSVKKHGLQSKLDFYNANTKNSSVLARETKSISSILKDPLNGHGQSLYARLSSAYSHEQFQSSSYTYLCSLWQLSPRPQHLRIIFALIGYLWVALRCWRPWII